MKRVGLITMHNVCNMGAVLQAYALQETIRNMGADCEIINYIPDLRKGIRKYFPKGQGISFARSAASNVKWLPQRILWQKPYQEFQQNYLKITEKKFYDDEEAYTYGFNYDVFVTGSDQVWNPGSTDGFDPYYFLDFVKEKKKVSYAASISADSLSSEDQILVKDYLSDFAAISIRESQSVNLLEPLTNKKIELVLDPTLLLTSKDWKKVAKTSSLDIKEKYLLIFMLGDEPKMIKLAKAIAEKKHLKIVQFGWNLKKRKNVDINLAFMSPIDFLKIFSNADYVVTNSFHGTAFAVNNEIDFVTVSSSCKNPRFTSLLGVLGIRERLYHDEEDLRKYIERIDYGDVRKKMEHLRATSKNFIESNIIN